MHHPHDQRFKALMASCLELIDEVELERAVHVPPQRIDVAFEPRSAEPDAPELGLLAQMTAMGSGMLEYYSHSPRLARIDACLRKRLDYAHERALAAGRQLRGPPPAPRLWILCAGQPRKALRVYEARPMDDWPAGFWQTRAVDRLHFVVLRHLPDTADTLLLRLLGRGPTLRQALTELAARVRSTCSAPGRCP